MASAQILLGPTPFCRRDTQYVSELLTELVEEGVLRRNGRELIIVDQSGLWHEIAFEELILNR
jgi:hypothetical protein